MHEVKYYTILSRTVYTYDSKIHCPFVYNRNYFNNAFDNQPNKKQLVLTIKVVKIQAERMGWHDLQWHAQVNKLLE